MHGAQAKTKTKPCRLLLIEDDRDDAFLFMRAAAAARDILGMDIEVDQVDDGLAALYLVSEQDLKERLPNAVILDLDMPRLNGIKFLHALRGNLQLKDVPVIVLTDATARSLHEEAILAGANRVLVKPSENSALVRLALEMATQHCAVEREGPD